jgi:hypothetical protein
MKEENNFKMDLTIIVHSRRFSRYVGTALQEDTVSHNTSPQLQYLQCLYCSTRRVENSDKME